VVKPAAFLPNPKAQMTTSVSRHGAEPRDKLIQIGHGLRPDRTFHGAAIFTAAVVRGARLDAIADEPPPRHANIVQWPVNADPSLQKAAQIERALEIASMCRLILFDAKA
ncbi:MAG: hypothetical protein QOE82_3585, partial [Thermoanaerobaculia bacterium]|nr:hypothetical protein [Thermoanaerobaculia bacterium]